MLILRRILNQNYLRNCYQLAKKYSTASEPIDFNLIKHKTKVPLQPVVSTDDIKTEKVAIDKLTLELLERLSLVNLNDQESLTTLEESIEFASKILHIDTTGIEPLYFVHEDQSLELREDIKTEGNIRAILLENAPLADDDCFIAPPGNIPVELEEKDFNTNN